MKKIVQISDLHFDRVDEIAVAALIDAVLRLSPDLIVVSGDLTQRARPRQFEAAREFLQALPKPQLIVPGNHDIPLFHLPERFSNPFGRYKQYITPELEPEHQDEELAVFGLTTGSRFRISEGWVRKSHFARLKEKLRTAPARLVRVVVTHHPSPALGHSGLFDCGIDLLLAGHDHRAGSVASSQRITRAHRSSVLIQAGTATSTRLRGERNSFNLIEAEADRVSVTPYLHAPGEKGFHPSQTSRYMPGETGWDRRN